MELRKSLRESAPWTMARLLMLWVNWWVGELVEGQEGSTILEACGVGSSIYRIGGEFESEAQHELR